MKRYKPAHWWLPFFCFFGWHSWYCHSSLWRTHISVEEHCEGCGKWRHRLYHYLLDEVVSNWKPGRFPEGYNGTNPDEM